MRTFTAPWGPLLKVTSSLLTVVLLGASMVCLLSLPEHTPSVARWLATGLPPIILLLTIPFVVRGYEVAPGLLVIRRLGWKTRVPLTGLISARLDPEALRGALRLLGNGGGFVFCGLFRSRQLGMFRAYINDPRRSVVLRLPGRVCVVSPENPEAFVKAIEEAASQIPGLDPNLLKAWSSASPSSPSSSAPTSSN